MEKLVGRFMSLFGSEKAQGLVEYMLVLVLVSIVVIIILANIGSTSNSMYTQINSAMP